MKKITILLLATAIFGLSFMAFKQASTLKEGVVEFDVTFLNLTPEMKQMESMMPKKLIMYFKDNSFRNEMPSGMGTTITINNGPKKEFYLLMDMMGQKTAMKQTEEEMKKQLEEAQVKDIKVTFEKETKVIAGYTCNKAMVNFTLEGKAEQIECFYTPELPDIANNNTSPGFDQIKGFMMEYSLSMQGVKMKLTASKVRKEKVDAKLFDLPEGYTIKTLEQIRNPGAQD